MHIIYMYVYVCTCIKVNTDSSDVVRCGQRNLGFPAFHSCDMGNAFFNVSWGCFSINKPISGIQFASELPTDVGAAMVWELRGAASETAARGAGGSEGWDECH